VIVILLTVLHFFFFYCHWYMVWCVSLIKLERITEHTLFSSNFSLSFYYNDAVLYNDTVLLDNLGQKSGPKMFG
jgi:hypothetical protein